MRAPTLGGAQLWTDVRYRAGHRIQRHVWTGGHRLLDEDRRLVRRGSLEQCEAVMPEWHDPPSELVLLLHGLGRRGASMEPLAAALRAEGHYAVTLDYASTRGGPEIHADALIELLRAFERDGAPASVCFVTHSMGGIVVRHLLARATPLPVRRVLMLAPPSGGAALARRLRRSPLRFVFGPALGALADAPALVTPDVPIAVVAGSMNEGAGLNPLLEGDDDGIVRVEETHLEGMSEHHVVPSLHTTIMNHPRTLAIATAFLERA